MKLFYIVHFGVNKNKRCDWLLQTDEKNSKQLSMTE
jgi:hypothetical protein